MGTRASFGIIIPGVASPLLSPEVPRWEDSSSAMPAAHRGTSGMSRDETRVDLGGKVLHGLQPVCHNVKFEGKFEPKPT